MKRICMFLCLGMVMMANGAFALSIHFADGPATVVHYVDQWDTTGADMSGMLVTVNFTDSSSETIPWNRNADSDSGRVLGNEWGSFQAGSTWASEPDEYHPWTILATNPIASIEFNGLAGQTVFDVWDYPEPGGTGPGLTGTANSEWGWQFNFDENYLSPHFSAYTGHLAVTYSNPIALLGADPVGDLYGVMTLNFMDGSNSADGFTGMMQFNADTDNVAPVPEPATMLLLATGLVGLAGLRRRKRMS